MQSRRTRSLPVIASLFDSCTPLRSSSKFGHRRCSVGQQRHTAVTRRTMREGGGLEVRRGLVWSFRALMGIVHPFSLSLGRFVNAFCDKAQKGAVAAPVTTIARALGIPGLIKCGLSQWHASEGIQEKPFEACYSLNQAGSCVQFILADMFAVFRAALANYRSSFILLGFSMSFRSRYCRDSARCNPW